MRFSQQRENIKSELKRYCIHPTAEELYLEMKQNNPKLSLATVYRNLNQLAKTGGVKKIDGLSEQAHYDHNTCEHFHSICEVCGKVWDLPAEMAESLKKVLSGQNEFDVLSYDITVKGICSDCKSLEKEKNNGI